MVGANIDARLRDRLVVLIGGSGFFGKHLAQELLARGARLRIASRHPEKAYFLKPLGNLGQVQFLRCDVTRAASLHLARWREPMPWSIWSARFPAISTRSRARVPGLIAAAARSRRRQRSSSHVSAIGADPESPIGYARSKGEGELAVRAAFPQATILRPSILFGQDDGFVNMFGGLIAALPALPVFAPQARLQPLFVDDAACAAVEALTDPAAHGGKLYEIAGPEVLTMLELNEAIAAAQSRKRLFVPLPDVVSGAIAAASPAGCPARR